MEVYNPLLYEKTTPTSTATYPRLNFCGVPKPGWHRLCGNRYPGGCDQQPPGTGVFRCTLPLVSIHQQYQMGRILCWNTSLKPRQGRLVEMNLSYGHNIGGLSNTIGPILGLGFAYRLNKSTLCKLDNIYDVNCYDLTLPENWRIYENVWYKD